MLETFNVDSWQLVSMPEDVLEIVSVGKNVKQYTCSTVYMHSYQLTITNASSGMLHKLPRIHLKCFNMSHMQGEPL